MTAPDLITQLALVDLDRQGTIFAYLADHFLEFRLLDGSKLSDAYDMMQWLRELSYAARMAHASQGKPPASCVRDRRSLLQVYEQTPRSGAAAALAPRPLSWKCDICHDERPDEQISVHKADIGPPNFPPGMVTRNVKYCNDRPACKQGAENWKEVRA
jgi:hypothetical protein